MYIFKKKIIYLNQSNNYDNLIYVFTHFYKKIVDLALILWYYYYKSDRGAVIISKKIRKLSRSDNRFLKGITAERYKKYPFFISWGHT